MSDDWQSATLGEVADWTSGATPKATERTFYDNATVPWAVIGDLQNRPLHTTQNAISERGLEAIGGAKKIAPPGSVLVSMYGSVGRSALTTIPVATNQAIARGVPNASVTPEYLFLWINANEAELDRLARGATQRNINKRILTEFPICIPPLPAQERIVEVIGAVDDQISALDVEARALGNVVASLLDDIASVEDTKPLGDLCATIGSGPSWAAADETALPSGNSLPVIKITNTRPDGSIDLSQIAHVSDLPARTRVVGPTSLVMIRTNGNRNRIGNIYMPPAETHGYAVSAFQFIVEANDQDTRDYLFAVLRSPRLQRLMSENASGSTGLGNLAVRWLKTLEIPWPAAPIRDKQVAMVRDLDAALSTARDESDRLRSVRAALLTALLNRDIEINDAEEAVS